MKRYGSRRGEGCICDARFTCGVCCRNAPSYFFTPNPKETPCDILLKPPTPHSEENIMAGKANPCGKTRPVFQPYEIWTSRDGSWEYRVLKKYQFDDNKPYARWSVAIKSPFGSWEYGDSYVKDVKSGNTRTYVDPTLTNI